ncbi:ABC-type nitrate/sulfonate/bicarbonate transport systems, periplasmic components [Pseudoalteromonas luteoviolacea B = ATCC 29581]|nr:ABC-type nitrate/sulfonate/bicarbonate transport systems, periplasmic components [Pseudoalteromonas luteoviolacea B = ATCC 29581]
MKLLFYLLAIICFDAFCDEQEAKLRTNVFNSGNAISIAVSLTPLSAPFFIAEELGFFKTHNLDVNILPCHGGVACSEMLFQRRVDLATFSDSVVMFKSYEHDNFSVITTFVRSDRDVRLLTKKASNINAVTQLVGKKIGVVKASASEFFLDSMLISHLIDSANITKMYLKPEQLNDALSTDLVDAVSIWEPHGYLLESELKNSIQDLSLPGIYTLSFNLSTLNDNIQTQSSVYKKVLLALEQSIVWLEDNPAMAQSVLAKKLNISDKQVQSVWPSYAFRLSLSNSLISELYLQARWAKDNQLVKGDTPNFQTIIQDSVFHMSLDDMESTND